MLHLSPRFSKPISYVKFPSHSEMSSFAIDSFGESNYNNFSDLYATISYFGISPGFNIVLLPLELQARSLWVQIGNKHIAVSIGLNSAIYLI